ncbi:hypothetical protein [Gordonia sp. (in: high G+C Gram-positive bacteria)]
MTADGIPTPRGGVEWSHATVRDVVARMKKEAA